MEKKKKWKNPNAKNAGFHVRLTKDEKKLLHEIAELDNLTASDLLRYSFLHHVINRHLNTAMKYNINYELPPFVFEDDPEMFIDANAHEHEIVDPNSPGADKLYHKRNYR
jgi:hypothetical protein